MTHAFTPNMLEYFKAERGAYSVVTADEFSKSQLTFVGEEKTIAESFFGNRLEKSHGSRPDILINGGNPDQIFRKFPTGNQIDLTVSYKKNRRTELRMYLKSDVFKPNAGEYWGIFIRDNDIWLCHFSERMLSIMEAGELTAQGRATLLEPEEDNYQEQVNESSPQQLEIKQLKWKRNPKIAAEALKNRNYVCELFPELPTFMSYSGKHPYQEAHHLVPMSQQNNIAENLDSLDNICVLGPFAHRKIHYATFDLIIPDLRSLISTRRNLLNRLNLVEDDIFGFYVR
ncbi:MAG: hypothetical protein RLZZ157_1480 [Pseudomonadota bacterium]